MIISIADWSFDVDVPHTEVYSKRITAEHCDCGYCRNFYAVVDESYPNLRPFIAQFGANVEGPDEMMPFEPTLCQLTYCISGRIISFGSKPIVIDETILEVVDGSELDIETQCPGPYFALITGYLELPWVLEEDMDEVISPANEPECLQRMWEKLLENTESNSLTS